MIIVCDIEAIVLERQVSPPSTSRHRPHLVWIHRPIPICCHSAIWRSEHGRQLRFDVDPKVEAPLGEVVGHNWGAIRGSTHEGLLPERRHKAHTAEVCGVVEGMMEPWQTSWVCHAHASIMIFLRI